LVYIHRTQNIKRKTSVRMESRCALIKVLEVMSMSVYTGLNLFNLLAQEFYI
jgi:hypothetical protein